MKTLVFSMACSALLASSSLFAQPTGGISMKQIPYSLEIKNAPVRYDVQEGVVQITSKGKTNLYSNPNGQYRVVDAPMVLFTPKGDFTLCAKVTGDLKSIYDVAALVVYQDDDTWAKFCYENSVEKKPLIVSVVTRTFSDDCNSVPAARHAYMAIVKKGAQFTFLYSEDNQKWDMIRTFRLELTGAPKVGFASHGSRGDGFTAIFGEIKYWDKAVNNPTTGE